MSTKADIRQRFKELEGRIDGLVQRIRPTDQRSAQEPVSEPVYAPNKSEKMIQLTVPRISDLAEAVPEIRIPGMTPTSRPLVTPIIQSADSVASDSPAAIPEADDVRDATDELIAALEAPLVATGQMEAVALKKVSWGQWWMDVGAEDVRATIAARFIGPWFSRSVIGSASRVVIGGGVFPDSEYSRVILAYVTVSQSAVSDISAWGCVVAVIGVLAGRGHADSPWALTLAARLVEQAVSLGQLDPQRALGAAGGRWAEYVQIACTVPERVANRIDPHSIPQALRPRAYFSRLARAAVQGAPEDAERVVELWAKLCRVGQVDVLCAELAAALATSAAACLASPGDGPRDGALWGLVPRARLLTRMPLPLRARVISGTVGQLDLMGSKYFGADPARSSKERIRFNHQLVLIMCVIMHDLLDDGSANATDEAVTSMLMQGGGTTSVRGSSIGTVQALGLSLQLLSGKYPAGAETSGLGGLLDVLPRRTFPGLLLSALTRVLIPAWSFTDAVVHARMDDIRPLTALILMCVGALSTEECTELSMSSEFGTAIPRFLDAPTPLVRLSGIIVADCIVGHAHATRSAGDDDGVIDFGLDDIIRDAQKTTQPVIRASAEYITETRRYARPIEQQWADDAENTEDDGGGGGGAMMGEAIEFMRAYNGIDEDEVVYAPRLASLTAEAELSSGYVKPRTPVFVRDCLAYLKNAKDDTERAQIGLFALASCIERATAKSVEEVWLQVANKVLHIYNRGPDHLDWAWDQERRKTLVALAIKMPELLGPFLADRSCDRNLTMKDREIVFSAIATACLQLPGLEDVAQGSSQGVAEIAAQILGSDAGAESGGGALGAGTVVRRSRRLDLVAKPSAGSPPSHLQSMQRKYASIVGPAFFFPLIAQYGRSDMTSSASDVRGDASQLERYV
ncbi:telomere binding protein, partial [Coemansia furcata]